MSVTIDLELQAGDVAAEIAGIATALETLEATAGDVDLDFNSLDVDEISGEIGNMVEMLEGLDLDLSSLEEDISRIENLDDIEIEANINSGSGNDGGNSSDGTIPPDLVHNLNRFGSDVNTTASATDGGERASIFQRTYGTDAIHIGDKDIGEMLKMRSGGGISNLGEHSSLVPDYDPRQRTAMRSMFGMEPVSMDDRRFKDVISDARAERIDFELERIGGDYVRQELSASESTDLQSQGESGIGNWTINKPNFSDSSNKSSNIVPKTISEVKDSFDGFGSTLRKIKPTMGKYMQLLAALIPVALALGTQLLGVAAAMGAVAAAGAGIIGLGLLGHAESMEGSFAQAKQQVQTLKRELFEVAQPTMQQFAPMQSRIFDAIPQGLDGVFEEMEGLTQFEDTLFNLGSALAGGMEEAIAIINRNEDAISQLATRFGGLIGSGLLDFFEWLIQAASENQNLLVSLGKGMVELAVIAYNLVMAIAEIVNILTPVISLFAFLSGFLNNRAVLALLTFITVTYLTIVALSKLGIATMAVLSKLGILGSGSFIGSIVAGLTSIQSTVAGLIAEYTALTGAAASAAAAMAMTGVGLLAVGAGTIAAGTIMSGGPSGSGNGVGSGMSNMGGGDKTVYNDNRQVNINQMGDDYASQKAIGHEVSNQLETAEAQRLPEVEMGSGNSDNEKDS